MKLDKTELSKLIHNALSCEFDENERIRMRWYDIILYLTMMIEVFYREYEDKKIIFGPKRCWKKVYVEWLLIQGENYESIGRQ